MGVKKRKKNQSRCAVVGHIMNIFIVENASTWRLRELEIGRDRSAVTLEVDKGLASSSSSWSSIGVVIDGGGGII